MAEYSAVALQTVSVNQNLLFTGGIDSNNCSIIHRADSGLINLRGLVRNTGGCNCNRRAKYKVTFGANIAVPTGGTAGAISLALALNGEPVPATQMIVTPAAVAEFFNVASSIYVEVPAGCCTQLSVKNTSTQDVSVQNANIIVERVA